jgi:murein DD-endopeptidase MepM/ murein hydrolase activator NlpD
MRLRLLLAGAVLPLVLWAVLPMVSQGAPAPGRLGEIQKKIQSTQGQIGRRKGTERVLTTQISGFSARIARLQGHIDRLERRQAAAQADLDRQQGRLFGLQDGLRRERARLVRLRARLHEARIALGRRLVELYQADQPDLVTVVLDARGFADLLERGEFMRRVSQQDQRIIRQVASAKAQATALAARLAVLEARQRRITDVVLRRRDEIAGAKRELVGARAGLDSARAGRQRVLTRVRGSRHRLEGALSSLRAEQSKIQRTLMAAQGGSGVAAGPIRRGSGAMIWPVNGPITSPFCERRAWESCHPGVDIGVPGGTPIRAAAAGRVALQQSEASSGGYGNFTCIQHTGSLSTCYAHQSRFAVSMGQSVSQGQVIGYVGCTGRCFGDHLHFEVRINGSVTNPLNYL